MTHNPNHRSTVLTTPQTRPAPKAKTPGERRTSKKEGENEQKPIPSEPSDR